MFDGAWCHTKLPINFPKLGYSQILEHYYFWKLDDIGKWIAMFGIQIILFEEHSNATMKEIVQERFIMFMVSSMHNSKH